MIESVRKALEGDLELLSDRDLLQGRSALVAQARSLADELDVTYPKVAPQTHARFLDVLKALGIGQITVQDGPDEFSKLLSEMSES